VPGNGEDRSQTTLAEFGELWFDMQQADLAPSTLASYGAVWRAHVLPVLGELSLASLVAEPLLLVRFKAGLSAPGRGEPVIRRTLVVLGAVLQRAIEWNFVAGANPVRAVRIPSGRRRSFVEPLAPAEIEVLRTACPNPRDATLISVLAYAGLRPGEALALRWSAVRGDLVLVERAVSMGQERATKTGRIRVVPMASALAADLSAWRRMFEAPESSLVFPGRGGEAWSDSAFRNWRRRRFYVARDAAVAASGTAASSALVRATPYTLRHSAASLWLRDPAMTPAEVAEAMGHSVQTLLQTYAHVVAGLRGETGRAAAEEIAAARGEKR